MIERLIEQLSRELEVPSIAPKSKGVYILPLEEDLFITISEKEGAIHLDSQVAPVPEEDQGRFFQSMLAANLFGQGTYGAILGLDEEGRGLRMQRSLDYPVDYRQFRDAVEDFINAVDFWRQEAHTEQK